ncbi:MAG TPA: hypothetical protein PLR90_01710 [Methylophilus sp.]|nr:hypothetical protein [Methylophilus sp.]HQQ32609.1 hypothetical protein [Methylophilus sp.]
MDSQRQKGAAPDQALVYECLERVLSSYSFEKSPRQQELLRYLVKETLSGNAHRLKGYTLGVELFGRSVDFDPTTDAIVRVEVGRLRIKLREYYGSNGNGDAMVFALPKGGYVIDIHASENRRSAERPIIVAPKSVDTLFEQEISLAVLPFTNLTSNPEQDYFVDGIVDNLIFELSQLSGLLVISRQSSFRYRNSNLSSQEIGNLLGVQYLLEGNVQLSDKRVRVTVRLIEAQTSACVWADRYDGNLQEIFALQDEITLSIVKQLQIKLSPAEAQLFGHEGTECIEAHDALLRGIACHWKYAPKFVAEARVHFTKAVELDPNYASAHAWLARTLLFLWVMRWEPDEALYRDALLHAKQAATINSRLPYVQSILGWTNLWHRNRDECIAACRQAVAIDPNNFEAYIFLSMSLSCAGFGEEALYYIEKAQRMNPHSSPFYEYTLGLAHYVLKNYDKAIAAFKRGREIGANFPPNFVYLCVTYQVMGLKAETLAARQDYLALLGGDTSKILLSPWLEQSLHDTFRQLLIESGIGYSGTSYRPFDAPARAHETRE